MLRAAAGPLLAVALLLAGGGVFTGLLTGSSGSGDLSIGWPLDPRGRGAVSSVTSLDAGLGLLSLGSLVVAGIAVLVDRRNRMVLVLAAAAGAFLLAALVLRYDVAPARIGRFDGHARHFALLALLLALSVRLAALRPRPQVCSRRFHSCPGDLAHRRRASPKTRPGPRPWRADRERQSQNRASLASSTGGWGRYPQEQFPSDRIAAWLREHAEVDARVLSPTPYAMTIATGRLTPRGSPTFCTPAPTPALDTWMQFVCSNQRRSGGWASISSTHLTLGP